MGICTYSTKYNNCSDTIPVISIGYHSVEYEVFVRYFSRIVNSISAQTLSPHFVSRKIISHEDQIEILSVTSPRRAASLLLGRVSSAVEAGVNESFYRFLDILEQYGTPATKEILLAIKRDLSMCKSNIWYHVYQLDLYLSNPKQLSCKKKECSPQKGYGEKRCEIQGGGQEMAVMIG